MLHPDDAAAVAREFGVADTQIRRDHLISHLLAVLAEQLDDQVVFFGGTALARTHLPQGRLSEDLDLFAVGKRSDVATAVERAFVSALRRDFGQLVWAPSLTEVKGSAAAVLRTPDGLLVRVQLLSMLGYPLWPNEKRDLIQRYRDVPDAQLVVPTRAAFAAAKASAWHDREAPRDLYDLWGLATIGAIDSEAVALFTKHGPTGRAPDDAMFKRPPSDESWRTELSEQTQIAVSASEALDVVRRAWASARQ